MNKNPLFRSTTCAATAAFIGATLCSATVLSPAENMMMDAAADNEITNTEIYRYGQALPIYTHQRGFDPAAVRHQTYDEEIKKDGGIFIDNLIQNAEGYDAKYIHLALAKTKKNPRTDVYLTTQLLKDIYQQSQMMQDKLGLKNIRYALYNCDGTSAYSKEHRILELNAREEIEVSPEFRLYTIGHELGHAAQHDLFPLSGDPAYQASGLSEKRYNLLYHTEENRADSLAAVHGGNAAVKGAYELFIANKRVTTDQFSTIATQASQARRRDEHDTDLNRMKRVMLIAGRPQKNTP